MQRRAGKDNQQRGNNRQTAAYQQKNQFHQFTPDSFVKYPSASLPFNLRHCGVLFVHLFPKLSGASQLNILLCYANFVYLYFLTTEQVALFAVEDIIFRGFQFFYIEDEIFTLVVDKIINLSQLNRIFRARFLTETAKDTA